MKFFYAVLPRSSLKSSAKLGNMSPAAELRIVIAAERGFALGPKGGGTKGALGGMRTAHKLNEQL